MSTFREAPFTGEVLGTLQMPVGTDTEVTIASQPTGGRIEVSFEGFAGENHSGLNRDSCVRFKAIYDEGTRVRNTRQVSIVSAEELSQIATTYGHSWQEKPPVFPVGALRPGMHWWQ